MHAYSTGAGSGCTVNVGAAVPGWAGCVRVTAGGPESTGATDGVAAPAGASPGIGAAFSSAVV